MSHPDNPPGYKPELDQVCLTDYDPAWPECAAAEIAWLKPLFEPYGLQAVEHIGSTAIPGMAAKPIIDIQLMVPDLALIKANLVSKMEAKDYQYWANNPDHTRMFFVKGMPPFGNGRTHHVHVTTTDSGQWHSKKYFRDRLRQDAALVQEYRALKQSLAQEYASDREAYTQAKGSFVRRVLQQGYEVKPLLLEDIPACAQLMYDSVHLTCAQDYTAEQRSAWAPADLQFTGWPDWARSEAYGVWFNNLFIGFGNLAGCEIDHLYTHHAWQGLGVGSYLLAYLESRAMVHGCDEVTTQVSSVAQALFKNQGYRYIQENQVTRRGVTLSNVTLQKGLL